jgi:protein phosphatase
MCIATGTDVGCVRSNNEDSVGKDDAVGLAILADGMGGHQAGEVAGNMAVGTILNDLSIRFRDPEPAAEPTDAGSGFSRDGEMIRQAIIKANRIIQQTAAGNPAYHGMGTTVVVAAFHDDRVSIAHVGDSRLYRWRQGQLEQLTTDHSLAHELIQGGYFKTEAEVAAAGLKNAITRALGLDGEVSVDLREDTVLPDDIYLLCSDGLTDMVKDEDIQRILAEHGHDLVQGVSQLIATAKQNGGRDNVSVILASPIKHTDSTTEKKHRKLAQWLGKLFAWGK